MSQNHAEYVEDWTTVIFFLLHLEQEDPHAMWGARKISEVIEAVARLHGAPVHVLRGLIR